MISIYSLPHPDLLELSHNTLLSCSYQGQNSLRVVPVKFIQSVVAMVPHEPFPGDMQFFVVEKPGLDVTLLGGAALPMDDNDDEDDLPL